MMNYLSSELESTTFGHFEAAAAALESTTSGGDGNASENNESNLTGEIVTSLPTQKEKDEEEKIYTEITKLTRSTVDRYAQSSYEMFLNWIYRKFSVYVVLKKINKLMTNAFLSFRYLDKIILDILYKSAAAVAEKETDQQLGNQRYCNSFRFCLKSLLGLELCNLAMYYNSCSIFI